MLEHIKNILRQTMGSAPLGQRLDSALIDDLAAKFLVHRATVFGSDRLDADDLEAAANYLADKAEHSRLDAGETLIVAAAGMLESKLSDQTALRPDTKARSLMTVTSEVDPGATTWSYDMLDSTGMADLIENYSDDLSVVSTFASKHTGDVLAYGKAYDWTWEDLLRAAKSQKAIRNHKANATREAFERRVDRAGALGENGTNVTGLLNNPNIALINAAAAAGGANAPEWDGADKTPAEILADLIAMEGAVITTSKGVHTPDTLVLPLAHLRLIETTHLYPLTAAGQNPTILEEFKKLSKVTRFEYWHFSDTANAAGTGERACMYQNGGGVGPELELPIDAEELPPQAKNLAVRVNVVGKIAGVRVRYPLGAIYMDSI